MEKLVAVCRGVGDFDEYIEEARNGFFMDIAKPEIDAEKIIRLAYQEPEIINQMGLQLKNTITQKFGTNQKAVDLYAKLIDEEVH